MFCACISTFANHNENTLESSYESTATRALAFSFFASGASYPFRPACDTKG